MTVIVVSRVTPALRGLLSRWMLEVGRGVFVGSLSRTVRDRIWSRVVGLKRLGACTMVSRSQNEQGFSVEQAGDPDRLAVDWEGLCLTEIKDRSQERSVDTANPAVDGCGGDAPSRAPDEAATHSGD